MTTAPVRPATRTAAASTNLRLASPVLVSNPPIRKLTMSKSLSQHYYDLFTGFFRSMTLFEDHPQDGLGMPFHLRERRTLKLFTPRQSGATTAIMRSLHDVEIGRASCRERVWVWGVGGV